MAEEEVLRYFWVMPEDSAVPAPRVIRVQGEKGERYEEVYADDTLIALKKHPAIMEARLARQAAMRKEAMELAQQLREAGKAPLVAYEEAWVQVFGKNRLNASGMNGSCKLEDMLFRLSVEGEEKELTEDEKQWLLEALLEDDDCLESEAGVELLRRLAAQLQRQGYGLSNISSAENDELMKSFAEALKFEPDSMSAYRDALFKNRRGQIMAHPLVGFRAPWGMGAGGGVHYRQAPQQVDTTESSGNTQPPEQPLLTLERGPQISAPGLNEVPGAITDFLATAPSLSSEEETDEEEEKTDEDEKKKDSDSPVAEVPRSKKFYYGRTMAPISAAASPIEEDGGAEDLFYTTDEHVVFGEGTGVDKSVQIAEDGINVKTVTISGSGYAFSGGNMVVSERLSADASAIMENTLVIGSTSTPLVIDVAGGEAGGETLTLANLDTFYTLVKDIPKYEHGSFTKTGSGTLSITGAVHGSISDVTVQEGVLELGKDVTMDVGANRVKGGSLENVQMLVTGEIFRPVTGDYVTVHNLITSANGTTPGILRDVTLYAGTSTEYVTLHNISFAGESTLTGYITFEKTQTTGDMSVAAGGALTVNNLTFDLRGLAMGDKTLIVVNEGASLSGWDEENVHFTYSGVTVNSAAVDFFKGAGIIGLTDSHDGDQFWTGLDEERVADSVWNTSSRNWSSEGSGAEAFTALSNVYFGEGGAADREISVTQDMVVANLGVTDGGYSFKGARVAVLRDASFSHEEGAVTFNNQLVVQGGLSAAEGSDSVALLGGAIIVKDAVFNNLSTTIGGDMTVGGKLTVLSGDTSTAGSLSITGNVTAAEMKLAVGAGSATGDDYANPLVKVTGNLTTTETDDVRGSITIGGTAKQYYTGTVTAGNLTVNTQENDVYFSYLQVEKLTVGEGASVHVQTSSDSVAVSSSVFPVIDLSGTLALDAAGTTYNHGYQVNVQNDAARLVFGSGSTIENLQIIGMQDNSGYTDVDIEVQSRSATVTKMQDLGTLKVETGTLTVKNAGGAVHGELFLNNGNLQLGENTNDIMAAGSGAVRLENGGLLDIGSTSQTLSSNNEVFLSDASSITGDADGPGLLLGGGLRINYEEAGNSIDTKLTVEENITLNSTLAGSSLEISGLIFGSGNIELTGPGSVVLSSANTGFTGQVTVQDGSTLTLQNADALSKAGVVLNDGATLALDAPDTVTLKALTFSTGSTLDISSIVGTDGLSAQDAVLQVGTSNIGSDALTLNVHFADTLDTMTTYNIMSGLSSGNGLSLNVMHNGVELDDSQYTLGVNNGVLYIYTMMGNVWDGEGTKIWSATGEFKNWSGDKYNEDKDLGYTAAIFRDLIQTTETETVTVQGKVSPGDIYFTAKETQYELVSNGTDGRLAAGTNIHKIGKKVVTLNLTNNATADTALGDVEVLAGKLVLDSALAAKGTVTVGGETGVSLVLNEGTGALKMYADAGDTPSYTYTVSAIKDASAELRGVTMDAAGIRGTKDVYNAAINGGIDAAEINASNLLVKDNAELQYLILEAFRAEGNEDNVSLSNVTLTSAGSLKNVTIGSGVVVDASGSYTLSGNITFDSALSNRGTVTFDMSDIHVDIGNIAYSYEKDSSSTDENPQYVYQFVKSDGAGTVTPTSFQSSQVSINGVNLATDLNVGVVFTDKGNGSFALSIGNDTVSMPHWDADWGKVENAPSLSRKYVGNAAYVDLASGITGNTNYYKYSSIVSGGNADKVNGGKDAIVVTLAPGATGDFAVGGLVLDSVVTGARPENWYYVHENEVWIEDRSAIRSVIGGLDNRLGVWTASYQAAATHVLVNETSYLENNPDLVVSDWRTWDKSYIIAGSRWCSQSAESYVTVRSGEVYNIFGASCGGHYSGACYEYKYKEGEKEGVHETCPIKPGYHESWWEKLIWRVIQTGTSHVYVEGGRIGEIFAGGFFSTLDVGEGNRAVEMVLSGGILGGENEQLRVFGGADHGTVTGDIYVRMEGTANILSILVGGSNAGTVNGDIVLDLISGRATKVEAPGKGWSYREYDVATINGDITVNLYSEFELGQGIVDGVYVDAGLYGGKEKSNFVNIAKDGCYSRLHFAEGKVYDLASVVKEVGDTSDNQKIKIGDTSEDSIIVTGFDRFELENKAHVVLGLGLFDADMDPEKGASTELVISGKGVVEVIGHGLVYEAPILGDYGAILGYKTENARNFWRDIRLEDSATLMISTSVIGLTGSADDRTITVTDGTTIDFSGVPGETGETGETGEKWYTGDSDFAGLGFNVVIAGHGVDGKGAIYKGKNDDSWYPDAETFSSEFQRIILPNVELSSSASVKVVAGETLLMNNASEQEGGTYAQGTAHLGLNEHTFTKLGAGDFIARSVKITPGTILVQQGGFGFDLTDDASQTDMVLAAGGELKLNASNMTTGTTALTLRSLSGAGTVDLHGGTLTLHTEADSPYYYGEYMTDEYRNDAQDYDQFSGTTGFGYAVFSGLIRDDGKTTDEGKTTVYGKLVKTGTGVHYISGSSSTYTGGTLLQKGRLYLLGTGEASKFTKGTSKAAAGVAGTGTIEWDSANAELPAELYLGHGTRIYNSGTTSVQGGTMTIGVEAVTSSVLAGFVGIHGTVKMGGEEYVEIDTRNLKSIAVNGLYADGTEYVEGTDIDRNKMLLVKMDDWETAKTKEVTSLSATGYNEATYSGVLSGDGGLSKVGLGTLELDQTNSYTGGTQVGAGTLRLRGWGTVGSGVVQVDKGASLMLAYNGGYDVDKTTTKDDETTKLANNITLSGTGDALWTIPPTGDESQSTSGAGHSTTDGLTAALISAVGRSVTFTLSGKIEGDGGVLHSGDGTLVLCGDSSYTGGTVITRGVVDVQSAKGLGDTAEGNSAVKLGKDADLHVTVVGSKGSRLVTTLASEGDDILGDVYIAGTKYTERVLHMEGNGYNAASTTLGEKGTFLLCGMPTGEKGVSSHSDLLTGSGTVVVSDATGSGTTATFDTLVGYTGDFRVEGDEASIKVEAGTYTEGSINVAGQQASLEIGGNVSIAAGESMYLRSTGVVPTQKDTPGMGTGAVLVSHGEVSVAADAVLSVRRGETYYSYNLSGLSELENDASVTVQDVVLPSSNGKISDDDYHKLGEDKDIPDYTGCFESRLAVNQQAVAGVKADVGLTLAGGCTYETYQGHISLMGGSLKLDTLENNHLTFRTTLDYLWLNENDDAQLVLFSDVGSVTFVYDNVTATRADQGVYYTRADRYLTGYDYLDSQTMLVYDSNVGVVYLQIKTPEPTTTTLGLVALAALAARRRRKRD